MALDAAGPAAFAGVLAPEGDRWLARERRGDDAARALFEAADAVLRRAGVRLSELAAHVYAAGPGSLLGLRLTAMAVGTWRRAAAPETNSPALYRYDNLRLAATLLLADRPDLGDALLLADWKKNAWHALPIEARHPGETRPADDAEAREHPGPVFHLPRRKGWQPPPEGAETLAETPERLPGFARTEDLLEPTEAVATFAPGTTAFRPWTGTRHR